MRRRTLPIVLAVVILALIVGGFLYTRNTRHAGDPDGTVPAQAAVAPTDAPASPSPGASPLALASALPLGSPSPRALDLTVDANGLSKSTVAIETPRGVIKFKFYSNDAPNTVKRIAQLIQQGFYNGLTFHRVVPGFVIQGGDPQGTGAGGSGVKLKAEFNDRRHIEGTVAMARASDPDSADSQFYITLGTYPYLDHNYTVFGQVIEGMDVAKKIQVGDKMLRVAIE